MTPSGTPTERTRWFAFRVVGRRRQVAAFGVAALLTALASTGLVPPPHSVAAFPGANGLIAFQREAPAGDHTQTDLFTVRPDGTGGFRLTMTPGRNEFGPAWDPTGGRLAFWRTKAPFGPGNLWVMDGDGSHPRRLTTGIDARDPAWNPAGTRLVYDRGVDDLFTVRVSDGRDRHQLTSGPALDFEPAWSPDGKRIAFTRGSSQGDPGDIYLWTLAAHLIVRLTHSPAFDHQVAWAPGGHRLVFERDLAGRSAIFTVMADGSDLRRLTSGRHFDVGPTYSPNGKEIVLGSDRGTTLDDLWVMGSDGGNLHRLLHMKFSEAFPDWQPAGS
jgi:TolB protein